MDWVGWHPPRRVRDQHSGEKRDRLGSVAIRACAPEAHRRIPAYQSVRVYPGFIPSLSQP